MRIRDTCSHWCRRRSGQPCRARSRRSIRSADYVLNHEKDAVESIFTIAGFSFNGSGQNNGLGFILLKDWSERTSPRLSIRAMQGRAYGALSQISDAQAFAFAPPPITELGNSAGFDVYLKDDKGQGHAALIAARNQLLGMASKDKLLANVRPNGQEDAPQFRLDIDAQKAASLGLVHGRRQRDAVGAPGAGATSMTSSIAAASSM